MRKKDVINAVNTLAGVKINKIKNDKVKFTLVADYRALRKASREYEQEQRDIIDKFRDDFADVQEEVQTLRAAGKPVKGHDEFLKAERDTNRILLSIAEEECSIEGLHMISLNDLVTAIADSDLSMEDISNLDGIIIE